VTARSIRAWYSDGRKENNAIKLFFGPLSRWIFVLLLFLLAVLANVACCAAYVVDIFASGYREQWWKLRWIVHDRLAVRGNNHSLLRAGLLRKRVANSVSVR